MNEFKGSSTPNKSGLYDFSMVNVSWCSNLEVIEEPSEPPEPLSHLNIQKVFFSKLLISFYLCSRYLYGG